MLEKLEMYNKKFGKNVGQTQPNSILKKKINKPPMLPQHKSSAMRAPEPEMSGLGAPRVKKQEAIDEEEPRLTSEEITEGIQRAQEAIDAPSLDLAQFEEALKRKHEEFKAAGVTPQLQYEPSGEMGKPKPKFKVGIRRVGKKQ